LQKVYVQLLKKLNNAYSKQGDEDLYLSSKEAFQFQALLMTLLAFTIGGQRSQFILNIRTEVITNGFII
jgi:hypothetical protein